MERKNHGPEEVHRAKIRELLQLSKVGSMDAHTLCHIDSISDIDDIGLPRSL